MLSGSVKRIFTSGPPGPAGATLATALTDVSAAVKAVLTAADLPSARAAFGLAIGSGVQAWSATLDALAGLATTAFGRSLLTQADAPTALGTLGAAAAARQITTPSSGGLAGGGDLSADRSLAIAAGGVSNTMLAQAPAGTLKANLLGSTAAVTDQTLSAILDALIGSGRGTIAVRGTTTWGSLALGASGYTLQSNGTDLVFAASSPGTGSVRYDTAQSLAAGQQDQVRANLLSAVPSAPAANVTLVATDQDRPIAPTAAVTVTAANGGAGWRSGPVCNTAALAALVTLAVPASATLDGVANGTTTLYPFQKARLVQTGAAAYVTDWIDRTPVVAKVALSAAVASFDVNLPTGFSKFRFAISGVSMSTGGATLGVRVSDNGTSGLKSGASDYYTNRVYAYGTTLGSASANDTYGYVAAGIYDNSGLTRTLAHGEIYPGATGQQPSMLFKSFRRNSDPNYVMEDFTILYTGATTGNMGRANLIRFLASAGNINIGATLTIWGDE